MTDAEAAIRAALLDTLIELGQQMLDTVEGRETVAEVLRKAGRELTA